MRGRTLDPFALARRALAALAPDISFYVLITLVLVGAPTLASDSAAADQATLPLILVLVVLLQTLATTILLHNLMARLSGAPVPVQRSVSPGLRWWLLGFALTLIKVVAVMLGLTLIVLPGVFIAVLWMVALPAMMAEGIGLGAALRRSMALTEGSRMALAGPVLAWLALFLLLPMIVVPSLEPDGAPDNVVAFVDMLFDMAGVLVGAAGMAAAYLELRDMRDPPARASIFE